MINILNLRNEKPIYKYDVIIDKSSPLDNPFLLPNEYKQCCIQTKTKQL